MTNKEKSKQIAEQSQILSDFPHDYHSVQYGAMKMAEWKDKQLKKACSNCEDNLIKMGKRCPWRSMSNDYCWEI